MCFSPHLHAETSDPLRLLVFLCIPMLFGGFCSIYSHIIIFKK